MQVCIPIHGHFQEETMLTQLACNNSHGKPGESKFVQWFWVYFYPQSVYKQLQVSAFCIKTNKLTFFITSFSFTKQNSWRTVAGKVICMLLHSIIWGTSVPSKSAGVCTNIRCVHKLNTWHNRAATYLPQSQNCLFFKVICRNMNHQIGC